MKPMVSAFLTTGVTKPLGVATANTQVDVVPVHNFVRPVQLHEPLKPQLNSNTNLNRRIGGGTSLRAKQDGLHESAHKPKV